MRDERRLAYTSLLCGLKSFFGIEKCEIKRIPKGKPYITNEHGEKCLFEGKEVYIGISHSNGVSAVCISNEGEVGVDIQSIIDVDVANRLSKRFFRNLNAKSSDLPIEYFRCEITGDEAVIEGIEPVGNITDSFTKKWVYAESIMKLMGGGFGDISVINDEKILNEITTEIKKYVSDLSYYIAISMKNIT